MVSIFYFFCINFINIIAIVFFLGYHRFNIFGLFLDDGLFTIEGEITEPHPCLWCYTNGRMKLKMSFKKQFVLDISINNDAKIKGYFDSPMIARFRGKN